MSGEAEARRVVAVHSWGGDDVIMAAEDEHGRPGIFVAAPLTAPPDDRLAELLRRNVKAMRDYLAHHPAAETGGAQPAGLAAFILASSLVAVGAPVRADPAHEALDLNPTVDVELLERAAEEKFVGGRTARNPVILQSPTGAVEYTLPLTLDETLSSGDVGAVLSPTGVRHRTIARHRRERNELLGVKIGNQYRYPTFQFDANRHEIRPEVAYANRQLEAGEDPWGTLDWWYSPESAFDGRRPVDVAIHGELTTELIDLAMQVSTASMD